MALTLKDEKDPQVRAVARARANMFNENEVREADIVSARMFVEMFNAALAHKPKKGKKDA